MSEDRGTLRIVGWMMSLDGAYDSVQVYCDAPPFECAARTLELPQLVAALGKPSALRAGFLIEIPFSPGSEQTAIELVAVGRKDGKPAGYMSIGNHRPPVEQDYPPPETMHRSTRNEVRSFWRANGLKACNDFRRAMAPHIDLDSVRSLLDWGCGAGRVTKHLIDRFPQAKVFGTDIDAEAVEWAGNHLSGTFVRCSTEPPLPFHDAQFDAAVSLSVFTHLTAEYQEAWLKELQRVIRKGGIIAATTQGEHAARLNIPGSPEHRQLMATGFSDGIPDDNLKHVASATYYRSTYQNRAYTDKAWGKWFDVIDYVEAGITNLQDIYILRRR